ncbi:type II toxin-antitoxin system RelE/ParE family toxin [Geomesophilobacter sediminis]|uniref:Plasmid stabilization protein n=1 Tax=Geomesophilobacter sediminis TaxID=2798584 RepID=A0A8J7IQQ0_9BACT|nr:plasmid stabilization protein [Geomesophilobacter sediminis]MBJ6725029.1 plasmid stabilization protein [Geomesophilobacter sediminis]
MYRIVTTDSFLRTARKFFRKHPDLRSRFADILGELQKEPFQPALGLHPLQGKLTGCYAVRLTYSFRVTLTIVISEQEITLLDIGSHDEVYR